MCSMSLLRHHQPQERDTAGFWFTKRELPQEGVQPALRWCNAIMLSALLGLVSLSSEGSAQVQEVTPPVFSSGVQDAPPARPQLTEKAQQTFAVQSVSNAASLPPVASIGPGSDIRPFLDAGLPQSLTQAALRRAWATDPEIRDFVGLSENSWDFNTLEGVTAFGSPMTNGPRPSLAVPEESATGIATADR